MLLELYLLLVISYNVLILNYTGTSTIIVTIRLHNKLLQYFFISQFSWKIFFDVIQL